MRNPIAQPCMGSRATTLRIRSPNVPCTKSVGLLISAPLSDCSYQLLTSSIAATPRKSRQAGPGRLLVAKVRERIDVNDGAGRDAAGGVCRGTEQQWNREECDGIGRTDSVQEISQQLGRRERRRPPEAEAGCGPQHPLASERPHEARRVGAKRQPDAD